MNSNALPPLDARSLIARMVDGGVEFLILGGFAVAAHGFTRGTADLDIVPNPDPANLDSLHAVLSRLNARILGVGDFERSKLPLDFTPESLRQLGNWRIATSCGVIDILQHLAGVLDKRGDYEGLAARAMHATMYEHAVLVVGYDDLIRLKEIAARPQDLVDIRALREANQDLRD